MWIEGRDLLVYMGEGWNPKEISMAAPESLGRMSGPEGEGETNMIPPKTDPPHGLSA